MYDERAVDYFFNEVHSEDYTAGQGTRGVGRIFGPTCPDKKPDGTALTAEECQKEYEKSLRLYPLLSSEPDDSAAYQNFVIILSSNADAIAETIGAFAENQVAIQSVNYLLNRDTFDDAATVAVLQQSLTDEKAAVRASLNSLFTGYETLDVADTTRDLAILQTLAVALAPSDQISFKTIEEAKAWFAARN